MAVDKDDAPSGTAATNDSVPGVAIEVHDDDIAVDLVVAEPQKPAETQADTLKGEAEPEEGEDEQAATEQPITSDQIRKPSLRRRMKQLERDNAELEQRVAMATRHAQDMEEQARTLAHRAQGADVHAIESRRYSLNAHNAQLEEAYAAAAEVGDAKRMAKISRAMAQTEAMLAGLPPPPRQMGPPPQQVRQGPFEQPQSRQGPQQVQQPQINLTPEARQWVESKADWIRADPRRLQLAGTFAAALQKQGFPPDDPEHYVRLDRMLKEAFDDFPVTRTGQSRGPGTVVAPASRAAPGGKKQFVVSPEDHAYLKRNGLLPNENPEGFRTWRRGREQVAAQGGVPAGAKVSTSIMIDA